MEFTEAQIRGMIASLREDFPEEIATRWLALLELEDLARKGCLLENDYSGSCLGCSAFANGNCPMNDWQKRHPEYANDELATKIRILEAGGKEAYEARLKRQAEAKKLEDEKKHTTEKAKRQLFRDLLMKDFAQTAADREKWTDEFEAHLEAYVQARINEKKGN